MKVSQTPTPLDRHKVTTYVAGFALSVLLTLVAYVSVVHHQLGGAQLVALVVGLAVVQLLVQLVFFLHLGSEKKPRINAMAFTFMVTVIGILVIGTLWIMANLNTHMMPSHATEQYMSEHEGI